MLLGSWKQSLVCQFSRDAAAFERVDNYKYLGTFSDHMLTFNDNTDAVFKSAKRGSFFYENLEHGREECNAVAVLPTPY